MLFCNRKRRSLACTALSVLCLLSNIPLFGQEYGSISGTVLDATGAAVPGANVTVTQSDTGRQTTVTTSGSGDYVFPSLPPARYNVKVTAPGFQTFVESNVILTANQSLSVVAKLEVGARAETIRVEGTTPGGYAIPETSSATRTDTPVIEVPQSVFGRRYTIEGSAVNLVNRQAYDPYEYFGLPVVMPNQPLSAYVTLKIHLNKE